jgi:hypothetical protein
MLQFFIEGENNLMLLWCVFKIVFKLKNYYLFMVWSYHFISLITKSLLRGRYETMKNDENKYTA